MKHLVTVEFEVDAVDEAEARLKVSRLVRPLKTKFAVRTAESQVNQSFEDEDDFSDLE